MCGIVGWIDWEEDLTHHGTTIEHMADTLSHRGPDAQGYWLSPQAALAHHRLIVIDPQGGKQPMVYQEGNRTYAITYNGEIYNFRELRSELESLGHIFRTQSDTEVLLHTYLEWGEACVRHLNGIFAFGLWDDHKQRLLLARDHLGVKPLFYAQRGSAILFASELKALLAHPAVKAEIDVTGMAPIFGFLRRAPGSGIFRDVYELRPGHLAIWTRDRSQIIRYWSLQSAPHPDDLPTTAEHIKALLEDTVRRQLIADVPVVTMLSGGLDSSALTALTAREFKREGKELHTYSIDFVDSIHHFQGTNHRPSLDAPWVKRVSEYVGSNHHPIVVDTSELIENLLVPMRIHGQPVGGQKHTSLYLLCKAMKGNGTVALSGESADELFGGYHWFYDETTINAPTFPWLATIMGHGRRLFWLSPDVKQKIQLDEYVARMYHESLAEVPYLEGEDPKAARRREISYLALTNFLPTLLDRKDLMSMAVGFEARVPFCDYRLVEYVWNIPWEMKTVGNIEKGILRQSLTGILPDDILKRHKSAYPESQDPAYQEATRRWTAQILCDPNAPISPFIDADTLRPIVEGKITPPRNSGGTLFERLIQINAWLQEYHVSVI